MRTGNNSAASVRHMAMPRDGGAGPSTETTRKESRLRKLLIFLGALVLAYIYSDSLLAQQSSAQRVSIGQAVDFPNDI